MMRKEKERDHQGWQGHCIISISLGEEKGRREDELRGQTVTQVFNEKKPSLNAATHRRADSAGVKKTAVWFSFVVFNLRHYFFFN